MGGGGPGDGAGGDGVADRAAAGAWYGLATDGGRLDADGDGDGTVTVQAADLVAVAGGDAAVPPDAFALGDLVVGVDAETLESYVLYPVTSPPGRSAGRDGGAR